MHYIDEGEGKPVLLLHGEPTWSFLWRHVIPPVVASGRRAVAPDLIGFGLSDKPEDLGWYTYDRHVSHVTRLVTELDLRDIALVVHDWGGLIGLRFAVENPERVGRLVILDTGVWSGRAPSETWLRFREAVRSVGGELDIARLVESGRSVGSATRSVPPTTPRSRRRSRRRARSRSRSSSPSSPTTRRRRHSSPSAKAWPDGTNRRTS